MPPVPWSVAVVTHGAGSSPEVAKGAFAAADAHSFWLAGHGGAPPADDDGATDRAGLDALVAAVQPDLVAGISYGAHQVARWAASGGAVRRGVSRLALLLPAWTGPPDETAAATRAQADTFDAVGVAAELARITRDHPGWVAGTLAASWPHHVEADIARALRAVASSHAPTLDELRRIDLPVTVLALADDPLHPAAVAERWAAAIPRACLVTVRATALRDLGDAVLGA